LPKHVNATEHPSESSSPDCIHVTIDLIVKVQALINERDSDSADKYCDLILELDSLHRALVSTGEAFHRYRNTSLGASLANAINPQVERCRSVLEALFHAVVLYRQSLVPTIIRDLWRLVWWGSWKPVELASLRAELRARRKSLDPFLFALNSYVVSFTHCSSMRPDILRYKGCMAGAWKRNASGSGVYE
jgi:hypothetical protein